MRVFVQKIDPKLIFRHFFYFLVFCYCATYPSFPYYYERIEDPKRHHVLHVVTVNPKDYRARIVKARGHLDGRHPVPVIARLAQGDFATNGSFFGIGYPNDGHPLGTLITEGVVQGINFRSHPALWLNYKTGHAKIEKIQPKITLSLGAAKININRVNKIGWENDGPVLYSHAFGRYTQSPYTEGVGFVFDQHGQAIKRQVGHKIEIPTNGFVVLLPQEPYMLTTPLETIKLTITPRELTDPNFSCVSGTPLLMRDGKVTFHEIPSTNAGFYTYHHARTAYGVKKDGTIVIVVAENTYGRDIGSITYGEICNLMQMHKHDLPERHHTSNIFDINFREVRNLLKEKTAPVCVNQPRGLSIPELAAYMKKLGCYDAINLDGGGSSLLWLKDRGVVNRVMGDHDEEAGLQVARKSADAIVFTKL